MHWRPHYPIFGCWVNRNTRVKRAFMHSQFSSCCNTPCAATAADDLGEPRRATGVLLRPQPHEAKLKLVVGGPIATIEPRLHARRGAAGGGATTPARPLLLPLEARCNKRMTRIVPSLSSSSLSSLPVSLSFSPSLPLSLFPPLPLSLCLSLSLSPSVSLSLSLAFEEETSRVKRRRTTLIYNTGL